MSKRQALGVISNNYANSNNALNKNAIKNSSSASSLKQQPTTATLTSKQSANTIFNNLMINNENEPPLFAYSSVNPDGGKKLTSDFEFEIFQEDLFEPKKTSQQQQQHQAKKREDEFAAKLKESNTLVNLKNENMEFGFKESKIGDKENLVSKKEKEVVFVNEDESEEDDDEDDEDEDEDDDDDDDDDDYNANQEELEEEGISRLNLAVIDETKQTTRSINISDLMNMDSTCSTQNDLMSPMVLDETIGFQTDEESPASILPDEDDLDEDSKRQMAIIERENQLMNCNEYREDILDYLRKIELENRPKPNYMKKQQDITSSMRSILVDWLVEVTEEYKLNVETLYLAVNYTDRFLSQMSVLRGKLQLVGTASMYIASKYEEISPPNVSEFVYITDDTYTKKQVLRMEHLLLKVLDFKMSPATINSFLTHYLRFIKLNDNLNQRKIENLARYLAELTLIDADTYLSYAPSQIAASAIYLALLTFNKPLTKQISDIIGYNHDLSELKPCIIDLFKTMQQAPHQSQQAIQEKYKQSKYDYVSLIDPPKSLPAFIYQSQTSQQ